MTTKQTTDMLTNNWPTIHLKQNILFEKKNRPWSDSNPGPYCPTHLRYLHVKLAGNAFKFKLTVQHDTSDSVKVLTRKKCILRFGNAC